MRDGQRYAGRVRAWVLDGDASTDEVAAAMADRAHPLWGRVTDYSEEHNLVTNLGRSRMVLLAVAESTRVASHIALSTTAVAPALTDTVGTITNRIYTQALTIAQSYLTYYQRYVGYFTTTSFSSTGVSTEALLDASSTAATTNLWADASITVSKSSTQSLIVEHQIQATT
ncbi:MAG: hypothetical protein NUW01_00415 [Gemmatimonadaceae bacterium]|nr:hypothetical protein [Gemmatimonadaceae bacterium]